MSALPHVFLFPPESSRRKRSERPFRITLKNRGSLHRELEKGLRDTLRTSRHSFCPQKCNFILSQSVEIDYVEIFPVRVTVPELKEGIGKVYASSKSLDGLAGISLMMIKRSLNSISNKFQERTVGYRTVHYATARPPFSTPQIWGDFSCRE